jgi:hypothetical protein
MPRVESLEIHHKGAAGCGYGPCIREARNVFYHGGLRTLTE